MIACRGDLDNASTDPPVVGEVTEFTVVHELGHIFDNRSTSVTTLRQRLYDFEGYGRPGTIAEGGDDNGVLRDCGFTLARNESYISVPPQQVTGSDYPVMGGSQGRDMEGEPDDKWGRGLHGWGTIVTYPNPVPTTFQQHPESLLLDEDREGEAAADMFLNWVYRRTSDDIIPSGVPNGACYPPGSDTWTLAQWNALVPGDWEGFLNIDKAGQPNYNLPGNRRYWWMEEQMNDILTRKGWKQG